ncbi:MAG: GatB/YqeY domain-containing protein [Hyphomicrobiales bacterium]
MSSLAERINAELKDAMKAQNKARVSTLRLVTAAMKDKTIANRATPKEGPLTDADIHELLAKMIKQRRESIETYQKGGRQDLVDAESAEIAVIEEFMPKQLSEGEMQQAISDLVKEIGAAGVKDMGRTMAALKERFAGRMDFTKASALVKQALTG